MFSHSFQVMCYYGDDDLLSTNRGDLKLSRMTSRDYKSHISKSHIDRSGGHQLLGVPNKPRRSVSVSVRGVAGDERERELGGQGAVRRKQSNKVETVYRQRFAKHVSAFRLLTPTLSSEFACSR